MSRFSQWLARKKDTSVSAVAAMALQHKISRYGRMFNFSIDSHNKSIHADLLLKGEVEPIKFVVLEYEIQRGEEGSFILVKKATASREWIDTLIQDFVIGKKFPVPARYAGILGLVA
jgi:hypothetical protein